jgi:hypothetical protein
MPIAMNVSSLALRQMTLAIITLLYITFGAAGYLSYGPNTQGQKHPSRTTYLQLYGTLMILNLYLLNSYSIHNNNTTLPYRFLTFCYVECFMLTFV